VIDTVHLEPSTRIFEGFRNAGYELSAAIADLVDNSIDAKAKNVLVRFVRTNSSLEQLFVIDDGKGMTEAQATEAMRFGSETEYGSDDLGMFGVGLKSASLSSADSLTVISRTRLEGTVGRRWTAAQAAQNWTLEILDSEWSANQIDAVNAPEVKIRPARSGTLIQWDGVQDFGKARESGIEKYLKKRIREIDQHLGLHFHRIIERCQTSIFIDSFNTDTGLRGPISEVGALDPFRYQRTGRPGYPRTYVMTDSECGDLNLSAHIWPKNSSQEEYRLDGVANRQGLYFYRNDRLLHGGGWCNSREDAEPHLSLARVAIDLPKKWQSVVRVRFNKSGVEVPSSFADALLSARSVDGDKPFSTYVETAQTAYREVQSGSRSLKPIIPPGKGIRGQVRNDIKKYLPLQAAQPMDIIWGQMPSDRFFALNRNPKKPTLTINQEFRHAVLAGRTATSTDVPLLKTLLYLLLHEHLGTSRSAMKDQYLEAVNKILLRAAKNEQ